MRATLLALIGLVFAASAPQAQDVEPSRDSISARTTDELRRRNREQMRLGEHPELNGVGQGENELRSRTPVLASAAHAETRVSVDENYARRRAMYADGSMFHRPLESRRVVAASPVARPRSARTPRAAPAPHTSSSWIVWVVVTLSGPTMLVILIRRWRIRPTPVAVPVAHASRLPFEFVPPEEMQQLD